MIFGLSHRRLIFAFMTFVVFMAAPLPVLADARDDFVRVLGERQIAAVDSYDRLDERVNAMNPRDPKKTIAVTLLEDAEKAVDDFRGLDAGSHVEDLGDDRFRADQTFEDAAALVLVSMNAVNRYLISPIEPGATADNPDAGTVPEGELFSTFIPAFIRLLFRFTSMAILISIIVSAILMVTALDNEEHYTKAKSMLTFSLVGFAFVALAFALVKAVTDIDFFNFI